MSQNYIRHYVHIVWSTADRAPLLSTGILDEALDWIAHGANDAGCKVIAKGGFTDHVHIALWIKGTCSVADVVRQMKSLSARKIEAHYSSQIHFRWQRGYSVTSFWPQQLRRVSEYILRQQYHHENNLLSLPLESMISDENPEFKSV